MTKKEDIVAAFEGRQPQQAVPRWELEFHPWNAFSEKKVVFGSEFSRLTAKEQERALDINAEVLLSVADELRFAALTVPAGNWYIAPGVLAYYILPGESRYKQIQILQRKKPDDLMLIAGTGGVMAMPGAEEYVNFSYMAYDNPEAIDQRAERVLKDGLENARRMRDLGVEAVFTASDVADNHGPFFKPELMERFIWPYLREWAYEVRAMGLYSILHSDGALTSCLDIIADSGIDALQAIDPVAGMDIIEVMARVGHKLCLCGNIDCGLLVTGPIDEIVKSTRELLLSCKTLGGFVLGASNAVQLEVPKEHYTAFVETWEKYAGY